MACHELAALRLGLMNILGVDDAAEKEHELAEIGADAHKPGPIQALLKSTSLAELRTNYENTLVDLEAKVSKMAPTDPQLPYYRTLIVMTKKIELDLRSHVAMLHRLYQDMEEVHDVIHEIYPTD